MLNYWYNSRIPSKNIDPMKMHTVHIATIAVVSRWLTFTVIVLLALVACAGAPDQSETAQPIEITLSIPEDAAPAPDTVVESLGRIAVIDSGGVVYTSDVNGEDRVFLNTSGQVGNAALLWSPDSSRVAYTVVQRDSSELITVGPHGDDPITIHNDAPSGAPFYLYWSPDGGHIAFLANRPEGGLALRVAEADLGNSATLIANGQPSYFSWAPDGQRMVLHIGGVDGSIGTYTLGESGPTWRNDTVPALFLAPAWSPEGNAYAFARVGDSLDNDLILTQDGSDEALVNYQSIINFVWSPDGQNIAYSTFDEDLAQFDVLTIVDPESGASSTFTTGGHLAYFWSPDSTRIAYLTVRETSSDEVFDQSPQTARQVTGLLAPRVAQDGARFELVWNVADISSGQIATLVSFAPGPQFAFVIPYFDQYAQSVTFWSPDSRYLLLAGSPSGRESAIYRVDTLAALESERLARIGPGQFAIWSWQ